MRRSTIIFLQRRGGGRGRRRGRVPSAMASGNDEPARRRPFGDPPVPQGRAGRRRRIRPVLRLRARAPPPVDGVHFVNGTLAGDAAVDALDTGGADVRGQGRTATSSSSASSTWSSRRRGTPPTQAAGAVRSDVQLRRQPEPLRHPAVLRAARVGVEDQPDRRPPGLQPAGAVPGDRGPRALTAPATRT